MSDPSETTRDVPGDCNRPGHCPICGRRNGCRLETGEAYKGPCWCESPTLCGAAIRRLAADLFEPRCFCQGCLEAIAANPEVSASELIALSARAEAKPALAPSAENDFYYEGTMVVFTAQYHLRRGSCCGSGCRHCPYRSPSG